MDFTLLQSSRMEHFVTMTEASSSTSAPSVVCGWTLTVSNTLGCCCCGVSKIKRAAETFNQGWRRTTRIGRWALRSVALPSDTCAVDRVDGPKTTTADSKNATIPTRCQSGSPRGSVLDHRAAHCHPTLQSSALIFPKRILPFRLQQGNLLAILHLQRPLRRLELFHHNYHQPMI